MFSKRISQSFNLSLEILVGCKFSCPGCTVDKNYAPLVLPEEDTQALLSLVDSLQKEDFRLLEFKVGPTDLVSSDNGHAALTHPLVVGLSQYYKALNINLALLHTDGLVELAELLDDLMPGKKLSVTIPLTLGNITKPKYMALLKEHVTYFKSLLKKVDFNRVYANFNIIEENLKDLTIAQYEAAHEMDLGDVGIVVEFPFTHSRLGFDNLLVQDQFRRDLFQYTEFAKARVNTRSFRPLQPAILEGFEFTYRAGKLYSTPVLVENLPIFDPAFELPKPWTTESVLTYKEHRYYDNLVEFADHPACGDCCFLDHCARGDVHRVMKLVGRDDCLTGTKNRWDLILVEEGM
ncbi:hypothetical protein D3C71_506560 [compost metagenome]